MGERALTWFAVLGLSALLLGHVDVVDFLAEVDVLNEPHLGLHHLEALVGLDQTRKQHLTKRREVVHMELNMKRSSQRTARGHTDDYLPRSRAGNRA